MTDLDTDLPTRCTVDRHAWIATVTASALLTLNADGTFSYTHDDSENFSG